MEPDYKTIFNKFNHDIRTPINAMGGSISYLLDNWDTLSDKDRREMAGYAQEGLNNLRAVLAKFAKD